MPHSSTRRTKRRAPRRIWGALLLVLQSGVGVGAPLADAALHGARTEPETGLWSGDQPAAGASHDARYCQLCRVVRSGARAARGAAALPPLPPREHVQALTSTPRSPSRAVLAAPVGARAPPSV